VARAVADIERLATYKLITVREDRRAKTERRRLMLERMRTIARTYRGIRRRPHPRHHRRERAPRP
jgi:hypothetical protein